MNNCELPDRSVLATGSVLTVEAGSSDIVSVKPAA
jgi:hypothetical protein